MTNLELQPSKEALVILENCWGKLAATEALDMARSGHHRLNPYHNLVHELQVVYWTYSCILNDPSFDESNKEHKQLMSNAMTAALFHDHNHPGRLGPDAANIDVAVKFVSRFLTPTQVANVARMISVTQFNGVVDGKPQFARVPQDLFESAIRDADLMSIYTHEGRQLLMGLHEEVTGRTYESLNTEQLRTTLAGNAEFLNAAPMHTWFGNRMKDLYLKKSIQSFEEMVMGVVNC